MGVSTALGHILVRESKEKLTSQELRFYRMNRRKRALVSEAEKGNYDLIIMGKNVCVISS